MRHQDHGGHYNKNRVHKSTSEHMPENQPVQRRQRKRLNQQGWKISGMRAKVGTREIFMAPNRFLCVHTLYL